MISKISIRSTGFIALSFLIWSAQLRLPKPYGEGIMEPIFLSFILAVLPSRFWSLCSRSWRSLDYRLLKAREESLSFGVDEFRHLVMVKRNTQSPGTFLVSPRPGRHVTEDVLYRDEKWRKQFFIFRVDRASVGDFGFSRLPRSWAERIG
ncbi:hypothetical protein Bca52824_053292 [Brassica carinata]|uniref:Uncharacterized protein n=1 Tax=Brassica carinata TaxID=52824 RepID=A0A8X7R678_BRACI|nr:hypothetical protein Bca52824_053292 [Brassica carinata]